MPVTAGISTTAGIPDPGLAVQDEASGRRRDHEAIARLANDLLPALMAKLAASGLGEIEVREGGWKARLRKPTSTREPRPTPVKASESHAVTSHAGTGHAEGRGPIHARQDEVDRRPWPEEEPPEDPGQVAVKSPAVGLYHPRRDLAVGMRVRAGDKIGSVDVLGVRQDVVAPVDGVIGSSLAEAGEAVEYGQELVRVELRSHPSGDDVGRPLREPATVAGRG